MLKNVIITDSGFCTIYSLPQVSSLFVSSSFFFAFIYTHVIFEKTESKKKKEGTQKERKEIYNNNNNNNNSHSTRISNLTILDFSFPKTTLILPLWIYNLFVRYNNIR